MSLSSDFIAWLSKTSSAPRCVIAEVGVITGGVLTTRYLSNRGYRSKPTDTPANQLYTGRISGGVSFTRRINLQGTEASLAFGDIELNNLDGALDGWLDDIWAAKSITVWMGEQDWPKSQFEVIFSGTVGDIVPKGRSHLSLRLRDIFGPLNSTLSTATVGGTGDNKDALRPICLGECFNVTPILIDPATQKYAVHLDAPIEAILEVRDDGVSVPFTADLAHGTFTLTNARVGLITCDVQGAKIGGVWRNDAGGLIEWVATVLGDGNFITSGQIDAAALTAFRAANPQPQQLYLSDLANRLSVMQQLAASVGATVTQTYDGKMLLVKCTLGTPTVAIGMKQMLADSFEPIGRTQVMGAIRIAAERNWTPQPASTIAASVTSAQLPIFGDEYILLGDSDPTVLADWQQSDTPEATPSLMVVESDISAEATRRLNLWKDPHEIFGWDGFASCLQYEIGTEATLTHDRFALSAGQDSQVVGVITDWFNSRARLELLV